MSEEEKKYSLLVDLERKQVGCVLLQAVYGGDSHTPAYHAFNHDVWFVAPTPNMRMIRGTLKEFQLFAKMCEVNKNKNKA